MDGDAVLTVAVLAVMGAGLISNRLSPASGVLGAVGGLFLLGVIDADDAFRVALRIRHPSPSARCMWWPVR